MRKAAVVSVGRGGGRKKPKQIDILHIYMAARSSLLIRLVLHSYTSALFLSFFFSFFSFSSPSPSSSPFR